MGKTLPTQCAEPQGLGNPKTSGAHWPCLDVAINWKSALRIGIELGPQAALECLWLRRERRCSKMYPGSVLIRYGEVTLHLKEEFIAYISQEKGAWHTTQDHVGKHWSGWVRRQKGRRKKYGQRFFCDFWGKEWARQGWQVWTSVELNHLNNL